MEDKKSDGQNNYSFAQSVESDFEFLHVTKKSEKSHGVSELDFKICDSDNKKGKNVKEILFDNYYYDVTDWIERHPGGDIINFYTEEGEDATISIGQFHHRSITKVMGILKSFKRRPASNLQTLKSPAQIKTKERHDALTEDFNELFNELQMEGLFKPSYTHVALRILECALLGFTGMALAPLDFLPFQILGSLCIIFLTSRTGWLQHEGGHHSLTGYPILDRLVRAGAFGIGSGLSGSWFSYHHLRHHAMPQRYKKDADLDTLPMLAFNKKIGEESVNKKGFLLQNQAKLFLVLDSFAIGMYWKYYLHPKHSIQNGRFDELFFIGLHYACAYVIGWWPFMAASYFGSILLIGNISLSHLHFPLVQDKLHWVEYALVHTTDIEPSWWCDWWMGYLNYQIEHHLFPTMPQYRNHLVKDRVKALAQKHGIPYYCCSYWEAVKNCLKNLHHVSQELREDFE